VTILRGTPDGWAEANQRYLVASLAVVRHHLLAHAPATEPAADYHDSGRDEPGRDPGRAVFGRWRRAEQAEQEEQAEQAEQAPSGRNGGLRDAKRERDEARDAMPAPPAIDAMAETFGLSEFERDVLLTCAGIELDSSVAQVCAQAHGDPARRYLTFGLALAALPDSHWSALTTAAPLRRWHLAELVHPEVPTTSPLRIDERVLHAIAGVAYVDPRIDPYTEPLAPPSSLPGALRDAAGRLAELWASPGRRGSRVQLHGRQRSDMLAVAAAAAAALGLRPVRLRVADLPDAAADRELLARLCEREIALDGCAYILDIDGGPAGAGAGPGDPARGALDFAMRIQGPTVLVAREPLGGTDVRPVPVAVGSLMPADARTVWADALGGDAMVERFDGWVGRVVGQFDLSVEAIETAAGLLRPALADPTADGEALGRTLWEACRAQVRPVLDDLTQRISLRARWEDLVLPEPQMRILREIAVHVRWRERVLTDWGFAARTARGLGTAVLFAGPSGTGKTLAAEVLAADLDLDLYRIDLSQVVSKYIGETEKNLRRVFDAAEDGGAVLLFDEADALFGKRSEVKDSHDRYANVEVSYLLQRMEAYRGLAILTTNLKNALDPAFLRRLRFVAQFPFPDATQRAEIWRQVFPPETPVDGLDPVKLSKLAVTGGTIYNIALSAAFLAADASEPVRMAHVLAATRTECAKLERPLTGSETHGWTT
jgi:hypothetical protein